MTDKELIAEARRTTLYDGMDEFNDLPDRLADALSAHQWRPIETVLGVGRILLWYNPHRIARVVDASLMIATEAPHWLPLPTPPEE